MKIAPYIVGYLDLLGFSSNILMEEDDPSHLLGRSLKFKAMKAMAAQTVCETVGPSIEIRWMSDTAVFGRHIEVLDTSTIEKSLDEVSVAMGIVQCRFSSEDYFSRGGISIGRMEQEITPDGSHGPRMHEELFGAGLVRAAEIEKAVARYPRVVVSARLAALAFRLNTQKHGNPIFRCGIELPYIDYLCFAEIIWPERPDQVLAGHAELVHNLVVHSRSVPRLREKAAWLLDYHNWHIQSRGGLDHLIVNLPPPDLASAESDSNEEPLGREILRLREEELRPVQAWPPDGRSTKRGEPTET